MTANNQVAEASVKYLAEVAGQAAPIGYKQTEVGLIPEDWDVAKIGQLLSITTGNKNTQDRIEDGQFPFFVRSQKIERINSFSFDGEGVLTAGDGVGTGKIFHYINGKFDFHQRVYLMHNFGERLDGYFFYIYFSNHFYDRIMSMTAKSSVDSVRREMIADMVISLPPKTEQTAIANALSDVDALINELEKLIAKKQAIKTATMQQLLTGRTRLPQFALHEDGTTKGYKQSELGEIPEDWGIVTLSELAAIRSGGTPSTNASEYWDGGINWCTPTDITALKGRKYLTQTARTITDLGVVKSAAEILPVGSIVMTSRATIGECAIARVEVTTNQGFKSFICNKKADNEFLFYLLGTLRDRFIGLCSGSTFLEISTSQVRSFIVVVADKEEQTAIAAILSDMDEEIQTLQQRLAKTQQIKQGMMQELLTGRIRLLKPQGSVVKTEHVSEKSQSHSWAFNEAVIIAVLAKQFGSEKYPLGRKRYSKLSYLLHRHAEKEAVGYLKKAAGPYNPKTKYAGPERIAIENSYIRECQAGQYKGFVATDNIAQAEHYFEVWYGADAIEWLNQFRFKKNDELELLATVDMAVEELRQKNKPVSVANVKALLKRTSEWKAKLERDIFSDVNIARAIEESYTLFNME
jgi:type I restriction enzyme S subunit